MSISSFHSCGAFGRGRARGPRAAVGRAARVLGRALLVSCLPLAAAAQEAPSAQAVPGVREALDARLPADLGRVLSLSSPAADDWTVEVENERLGERHRTLARWLAAPDDAATLEELAEEGVELFAPEPAPESAGEGPPASAPRGWRAVRLPERGAAPPARGRADLERGLRALLPGGRAATLELKTWQVRIEGDELHESARLHASGEPFAAAPDADAQDAGWELTATWSALWGPADGSRPRRLRSLTLEDVSLVRGPGPRFVDRTPAVFGATSAFREELAHGLSWWRRRLDTRLGLPILGHPSGLAVGDVDGDGLEDVFLAQPGGLANRLFLHRPDGAVVDVSARAGVDHLDFTRAALLLDLDRDGDRDLVVVIRSELVFLSNRRLEEGRLRFEEEARFPVPNATMLAAADADLDGDLDLYACAYFVPYDGGAFPLPYHDARNGARNVYLVNEGSWSFRDATEESGLEEGNDRFSFAASWEDYDDDGDPDLYVANDFGRNNLYRNDGGRFVEVSAAAGVEDLAAGMGVAWDDYDGDGRMDLYVSNMYSSAGKRVTYERRFHEGQDQALRADLRRHALGNTLFRNRGDGTFEDVTSTAGVAMGRWSWGSVFLDLDDDGALDLFVPNGFLTEERADDL